MRSVPGLPLLLAAERLLTGCHLSVDVVLGDVAVTQGRSYWACAVDPASYLVKVGVGLESKLQESFQGPPDVISPRSGFSGRDGVWGPWVGELGQCRVARGAQDCRGGAGRRLRGSSQIMEARPGAGASGQGKDGLGLCRRAIRVGFWSIWLGKKMIEEGASPPPPMCHSGLIHHLSKPPCPFSLTPRFQHPFLTSHTFSTHIFSQHPKIPLLLPVSKPSYPQHPTKHPPSRPSPHRLSSTLCPNTPFLRNAFSPTPVLSQPRIS